MRDPRHTPAASEPRLPLADPGLPESALRQRVYRLCRSAALTCVVFGPGPVEQCLSETIRAVPSATRSRSDGSGFGLLDEGVRWAAVHGPTGCAVLFFPDDGQVETLLRRVTDRLPQLRPPWRWTLEVGDGDWQQSVVSILHRAATTVPAWDLGVAPIGCQGTSRGQVAAS